MYIVPYNCKMIGTVLGDICHIAHVTHHLITRVMDSLQRNVYSPEYNNEDKRFEEDNDVLGSSSIFYSGTVLPSISLAMFARRSLSLQYVIRICISRSPYPAVPLLSS